MEKHSKKFCFNCIWFSRDLGFCAQFVRDCFQALCVSICSFCTYAFVMQTWHRKTFIKPENVAVANALQLEAARRCASHPGLVFGQFFPSPPLDNIRVMVTVWRLRENIIRTAPCWVVWHNVHSQQHTHMSSSYRSSRLGLSHWDPYAMHRGGCLELYYCNMVEWCWWDSSLICKTNWFPSVLWHCWFGHMTCINRPRYDL